jgi:hypothetical protein
MLRQGDAEVLKKYSQMKLQRKREALAKLNRQANENRTSFATARVTWHRFDTVLAHLHQNPGASKFLEVI